MKLRLILPGVLALVLLLAACSPPPPLRDDTLLQDTSLLSDSDPSCALPCWRGITPGKTSWNDALTKLQADTTIENVNVQSDDQSSAKVADFQQKGGTSCCQMITEDGNNVTVIFLRVAPKMSLGQLIEAQGEPKYVIGSPYTDTEAVMNLIYPDKSLVIYAFVAGTTGTLSASSEIVGVLYMQPSDMDLLLKTSNLDAWAGYKSYEIYSTATYQVTPSITLTPTPGS
ncbi:MAG TPA: hypothetical protein VHD90_10745 [Phototrophicaceae bacterium]|nr:hypothetical protein [Phototrophicaceae bacterium]